MEPRKKWNKNPTLLYETEPKDMHLVCIESRSWFSWVCSVNQGSFIYMLPMQTFQVPPAFLNGWSKFCKRYKRKAILAFSCSPLDHSKGDGKFLFGEIPAQPPAGGKTFSLLSHLPPLTGQKTHREKGNLRKKLTGKAFTLHCSLSEPFPVKSYIGKEKWQWDIF